MHKVSKVHAAENQFWLFSLTVFQPVTSKLEYEAINPRTVEGLGQLRTNEGGRIPAPVSYRKRSKQETSGKQHWIQVEKIYNVYFAFFRSVKKWSHRGKKIETAAVEEEGVFVLPIIFELSKLEQK